jgi:hypothetical protein
MDHIVYMHQALTDQESSATKTRESSEMKSASSDLNTTEGRWNQMALGSCVLLSGDGITH